ncbi:MAG: NAD(P)/FAD-dependent oxidoreductase [Clostridiales bacterium]|nr:NAD(P)/FAD-dependent oxidoreductase [Clostridiales bacterium]
MPRPVNRRRVLVVGGGPAGLLAAAEAARRGLAVTLLEKNPAVGKKLLITGKGRCNLTTACDREDFFAQIARNPKFLYSAFAAFDNRDAMALFASLGVPLKVERGQRVFPASDRAADVRDALLRHATEGGAQVRRAEAASLLLEEGEVRGLRLADGRRLEAEAVVIATGGLSYPGTGSTGDGYRLAAQAGHSIVEPTPSLVPLLCAEDWVPALQGLSLRNVRLSLLTEDGQPLYSDQGELLFTHFGLSGPLTLSASAAPGLCFPARAEIDLKPALPPEKLDARLLRDFAQLQNRDFANALDQLLPRALIPVVVARSGIPPQKKVHSVTAAERAALLRLLKALPLTVTGTRPLREAIVTRGGVDVAQVSPQTLQSRLCRGLFFAGEVLDLDGLTGGFNLQIAYSTGALAGRSV